MATCSTPEQEAEQDTCTSKEVTESKKGVPKAELDFDFVEQPDQDLYCPVTLEILLEPHQTDCCGQHISEKAANRIIKDGKPCPMCKDDHFTTRRDKYFKRNTINKLRVYCLHKKSGCEWTGELGDLNNHSTSCPKRPWKCQYCGLESTDDVGTNEHTPNCAQYPLPCPNQCEIGTVPRCDAEKHLLVCPLQLVECEFANVGCEVKVPRRDLTRHMTENAQHHLMSATLLNLRLTRELHQKMEEKDQQITELQQQVTDLDAKIETKIKEVLQQQNDLKATIETNDIVKELEKSSTFLMQAKGFTCYKFIYANFRDQTAWTSSVCTYNSDGVKFNLGVFGQGFAQAVGNHLTGIIIFDKTFRADDNIKCIVYLQILNQLGDYGHYIKKECQIMEGKAMQIGLDFKTFPLTSLKFNADTNTQYLKDDCLKFRLFLKLQGKE